MIKTPTKYGVNLENSVYNPVKISSVVLIIVARGDIKLGM